MVGVLGRGPLQALLCRYSRSNLSQVFERPFIFCNASIRRMSSGVDVEAAKTAAVRQQLEAAAREDRLDFLTATKILFSTPAKPRTFGLDFHLWQFFVALLPPFAVYLTAQYARYEIRRMEKERDEAEKLKLQAALAEVTDEKSEIREPSSTSVPQSDSSARQQEAKDGSKPKNKDEPVIMLPEKDFLAMKARLEAIEGKLKVLDTVRPGSTLIIPLDAEPNVQRVPTKENTEKPAVQATDQAKGGEQLHRKLEKQKSEVPLEVQNKEGLEVSQAPGRSWFGFRSKVKERDLSDRR